MMNPVNFNMILYFNIDLELQDRYSAIYLDRSYNIYEETYLNIFSVDISSLEEFTKRECCLKGSKLKV